jgi:hypothetical protein
LFRCLVSRSPTPSQPHYGLPPMAPLASLPLPPSTAVTARFLAAPAIRVISPSRPALPLLSSASAGGFPHASRAPCSAAREHRRGTVRVSPPDGLILSLAQCRPDTLRSSAVLILLQRDAAPEVSDLCCSCSTPANQTVLLALLLMSLFHTSKFNCSIRVCC